MEFNISYSQTPNGIRVEVVYNNTLEIFLFENKEQFEAFVMGLKHAQDSMKNTLKKMVDLSYVQIS